MADIDIRIIGQAGRITLNRPAALNALTYDMAMAIYAALLDWSVNPLVSLVIIDAPDSIVYVDNEGSINYDVEVSDNEATFIYGIDKLTVCQPTGQGSICY